MWCNQFFLHEMVRRLSRLSEFPEFLRISFKCLERGYVKRVAHNFDWIIRCFTLLSLALLDDPFPSLSLSVPQSVAWTCSRFMPRDKSSTYIPYHQRRWHSQCMFMSRFGRASAFSRLHWTLSSRWSSFESSIIERVVHGLMWHSVLNLAKLRHEKGIRAMQKNTLRADFVNQRSTNKAHNGLSFQPCELTLYILAKKKKYTTREDVAVDVVSIKRECKATRP